MNSPVYSGSTGEQGHPLDDLQNGLPIGRLLWAGIIGRALERDASYSEDPYVRTMTDGLVEGSSDGTPVDRDGRPSRRNPPSHGREEILGEGRTRSIRTN